MAKIAKTPTVEAPHPAEVSELIGREMFTLEQTMKMVPGIAKRVRISLLTQGSLPHHVKVGTAESLNAMIAGVRRIATLAGVELEA